MSTVVEYDANKNAVDSVTVFQTNRAEVNRKIKVDLNDGQNDVEIKNLPSCIEESSIRVDGIGNATIFDVIYHPPQKHDLAKQQELLRDLRTKESRINDDLEILEHQSEVLKAYSQTITGKDTDTNQLETFLDVYATRKAKLNEGMTKLEDARTQVKKEIAETSKALDADEESVRRRGVRVTIVVLANGVGIAELSLTYVVSGAWWTPQYDLRAVIAPDAKSESRVSLHYRASIMQMTGEDWAGVALTLSTAAPLLGTDIPSLQPYWIPERERPAWRSAGLVSAKATSRFHAPGRQGLSRSATRGSGYSEANDDEDGGGGIRGLEAQQPYVNDGVPACQPPNFFHAHDSQTAAGAVIATFSIPGLSTIPSDSSDKQQTHKVSVADMQFESVDLEWITVPKDVPSVFLRCKVKNTSKYRLLPGQGNVFLNGSFVAKASIPHVSPQEIFSCSLGVDPAVRATYHPQTKKTKTSGGSVLSTKVTTTTFEQIITIKNTRLSRLPRLIVKDQVPVSRDARVKVNVLEPKGLSRGKGKTVDVREGVLARWATRGEEDAVQDRLPVDLDAEHAQGLMEWVCEVEPGATMDVGLSWEVSAPPEVKWMN